MKWPWSRPSPALTRATDSQRLLAVTVVGQSVWALVDFAAFVREGYSRSPIVYRCVRMIADMAAATPLLLNGDPLDESRDPLASVLRQPSDTLSGPDLLDAIAVTLTLAGEAFVEGIELRGTLAEIATMRPDYVKVVPAADGSVMAYEFDAGSGIKRYPVPLPGGQGPQRWCQVCHIRTFHPTDAWRGHSAMLAASGAIMEHNGTGDYARALLRNAARPSGALVYAPKDQASAKLTDEQFERLRRELDDAHAGVANAGRPMLLEGGLAWVPMSITPKDMEAGEARAAAAREIALALGVPPLLLGLPGDNTFANYREANLALWRQTVRPLLSRVTARLTRWVQPLHRGAIIAPDYNRAPIAEEERAAAFERLKGADWLTVDEKRAASGYPPLEGEEGKAVLVSSSMATLADVASMDLGDPAAAGRAAYGADDAEG